VISSICYCNLGPEENPNLSDDILDEVQNYIDQIVSGEIEVPTLPVRLQ